jgi:hypothetical protein
VPARAPKSLVPVPAALTLDRNVRRIANLSSPEHFALAPAISRSPTAARGTAWQADGFQYGGSPIGGTRFGKNHPSSVRSFPSRVGGAYQRYDETDTTGSVADRSFYRAHVMHTPGEESA